MANMILNSKKLKFFRLKSGTRKDALLTTSFQHSVGSPSHHNQTIKEIKMYSNWHMEEVKLSSYANDMILYAENPEDAIPKLLELDP